MIRAAFFDVDGTLLSHKTKQVSQSTRMAIARLRAAGIQCVVATGRQLNALDRLPVGDIPFDAYLTLNGQMLSDAEKNLIFGIPITGKAKQFLIERFTDHTFPAMMVAEKDCYLNYISEHVQAVQAAISTAVPPLGVYRGEEIYQVCAYLRPDEEALLSPIAEECVITRWHFGGMDVIAKGGGKMQGIRRYLEIHKIAPEEIIAFGDGENDEEMIRFAGIGVAMGNAEDCVKQAADYVTDDVDRDGIAKALRHFHLI